MDIESTIVPDRFHLSTGRPHGRGRKALTKRAITCIKTMEDLGINPFKELARLAVKAEKNGDLATASTNWRHISEYVDAKRKAVDPTENALKQKELMTLEELGEVKRLILYGGDNPPKSEKEFKDSIIEGDSLSVSNSDNCPFV